LEEDEAVAAADGAKFVEHPGRHEGGIAWSFHKLGLTQKGTPLPPGWLTGLDDVLHTQY
jgi:hypothetical protein